MQGGVYDDECMMHEAGDRPPLNRIFTSKWRTDEAYVKVVMMDNNMRQGDIAGKVYNNIEIIGLDRRRFDDDMTIDDVMQHHDP